MKNNMENLYSEHKAHQEAALMQKKIKSGEAKDYNEAEKLVEEDNEIKREVEKIIGNYDGNEKELVQHIYEFMHQYFKNNESKGEDFDKDTLYSFCYQIMGKMEPKLLENVNLKDDSEKQIILRIVTNFCDKNSMIKELKIPDNYKENYGLSVGREQFFNKELASSFNFLSSDELIQIILGDSYVKYTEISPLLNDFINNKDFDQNVLDKKEEIVEKIKHITQIFKINEEKIKSMKIDTQKYQKYVLNLDLIRTPEIRSQIENKWGGKYLREIVHICGTTRAELNTDILFTLEHLEEYFLKKRIQLENMCWFKFKVSLHDKA